MKFPAAFASLALAATLDSGAYTVVAVVGPATGVVLVEVYQLP